MQGFSSLVTDYYNKDGQIFFGKYLLCKTDDNNRTHKNDATTLC